MGAWHKLPKGVQKKINTFLIEICHLPFETVQMGYSGAWRKLIHEKNMKSKISWHCPFKLPFACTKLYILEVADSSRHALPMEIISISHDYESTGPLPPPPHTHTCVCDIRICQRGGGRFHSQCR
jgi:hypothetical protein